MAPDRVKPVLGGVAPVVSVMLGPAVFLLIRSLNNNTHPSISERAQKSPATFVSGARSALRGLLSIVRPQPLDPGIVGVCSLFRCRRVERGPASAGRARGQEARVWLPIDDGPSCRLSDRGRRRMRDFRHDRCGKCGPSWLGSRLLGSCLCYRGCLLPRPAARVVMNNILFEY